MPSNNSKSGESASLLPVSKANYGATPTATSDNAGGHSLRSSLRVLSTRLSDLMDQHMGSIGYLGSLSIAVNSLTGPAMLNLPATFLRSGIIPTLATLVFVCILAALCCLHMSNTISKVQPNNRNFEQEIEFSQAFEEFWGHKWFLATQVLFFCCISCLNISSIGTYVKEREMDVR